MKERTEKEARFMKLNRLFTKTTESVSFERLEIESDSQNDKTLEAARVEYDRISTRLVDEADILHAVTYFNQAMFPWEITYSKKTTKQTRDPEYYDEEIHAIEHIARKLDLISAFDKACVEVDLLNSREPMDKFQETLLNTFIDGWFDENMFDVICLFTPSGMKSLLDNFPNYQQNGTVIGAFGENTNRAAEEAGLNITIKAPAPIAPSMVSALDKYLTEEGKK